MTEASEQTKTEEERAEAADPATDASPSTEEPERAEGQPPPHDPLAKADAEAGIRQPGTTEVPLPKIYPLVKRLLEIPVSLAMLAMLSPILVSVYIVSLIRQGYPVVFKYPRVGKNGRHFTIYKFRTMENNAKEKQAQGVPHHELITPMGHFLRNTHLDEVTQIFNVVLGDISFVGPRPIDEDTFKELLEESDVWHNVLKTRPGITCLESIMADLPEFDAALRKALDIPPPPKMRMTLSLPRRYPLDMFYIENESLWMDILCCWYTLRTVTGRAAKHQ